MCSNIWFIAMAFCAWHFADDMYTGKLVAL